MVVFLFDITVWSLLLLILIVCVSFFIQMRKSKRRSKIKPKDVVVLYQVGRGVEAPSPSPFPLKLETFLRMHKIPYTNDHTSKFSSKGKTPWIQYNGVSVADSQLSINFLRKTFNLEDEDLTPVEEATGRAFQKMTEENLYWTMCHSLFIENQSRVGEVLPLYTGIKLKILIFILSRVLRLEMWGHGIGRHSSKDIEQIGSEDLLALSTFLGEKKYFLGEEPREVDCAIFGMLVQIAYHMPGTPHERLIHDKYRNLLEYCERMKAKYWPDWEDRCFNADNVTDDMGHIYHKPNGMAS